MLQTLATFFGYTVEQMAQLLDEMAADCLVANDALSSFIEDADAKGLDFGYLVDTYRHSEIILWLDGYLTAAYRAAVREGVA